MTHPDPDLQALIDVVDLMERSEFPDQYVVKLYAARERLRPKPEMEKVLPDEMPEWWEGFSNAIYSAGRHGEGMRRKDFYNQLVTLTMRQVQK